MFKNSAVKYYKKQRNVLKKLKKSIKILRV